jgi:hypothetical protein
VETDADIPVRRAVLAAVATQADKTTLAEASIQVAAGILAGKDIPADEVTTGATTIVDAPGATVTGIVAVVASASDTMPHLTHIAPVITTSRTIAIPTATTIDGAIGIRQPLAATPTRTGINASR